jgi:hypothetical protein
MSMESRGGMILTEETEELEEKPTPVPRFRHKSQMGSGERPMANLMVDNVAMGQVSLSSSDFPANIIPPRLSILISPEGPLVAAVLRHSLTPTA